MSLKFSVIQNILLEHSIEYKSFSNGTLLLTYCPFHDNTNSPSLLIMAQHSRIKCQNPSCSVSTSISEYLKKLGLTEYICSSDSENFVSDQDLIDSLFVARNNSKGVINYTPEDSSEIYKHLYLPDFIKDYLLKRGFSIDFVREHFIGYDNYKKCITIPFFSSGKFMGINKRLMKNESFKYILPKHLPKTKVYSPSNKIMNSELYITEGIFDCLSLLNLGLNSVCTFGSNFDKEQIENAYQNSEDLILFFDNDKAGEKATERWLKFDKNPFLRVARPKFSHFKDPGDCRDLTDIEIYDRFEYVDRKKRERLRM